MLLSSPSQRPVRSFSDVVSHSFLNLICKIVCGPDVLSVLKIRCALLGAGFAGLSVAWHLLQVSPSPLYYFNVCPEMREKPEKKIN